MDKNLDILIVDDSVFFTQVIGNYLRGKNLKVATINESGKVMEFLKREQPKMILLDIMMPDLDGISLCRMIKDREDFKDIRIIIFSTKLFEADKERAYQSGAEAFITKNISIEEIGNQVTRLIHEKIKVRFWGTRGSIPTPGPNTMKYGGNTPCVEVNLGGDYIIILDAGSGIRDLGNKLIKSDKKTKGHIFLTHFHWDHIQGLPFFAPAYIQGNVFTVYGCEDKNVKLGKVLSDQMESVYFPVPLRRFGASLQFHPLIEGDYLIESFRIKTSYLNHPSNTMGYLILHRGKTIAYITDNEFISGLTEQPKEGFNSRFDEYNLKIIEFIKDVDLLIIDAQYTKEEYQSKRGWGHSHYVNVIHIALAAKVKKCVLFHHDPSHNDDDIDRIVRDSQKIIEERGAMIECIGAQEGLEIIL